MKRRPAMLNVLLTALLVAACGGDTSTPATSDAPAAPDPLAEWRPSPAEEAAAVEVVQRLFDALETGDEALLREVMDPSVVMHFTETRDGETMFGNASVDGLATRITSSVYVGAEFSHCGIDVATILNDSGQRRIVALSWTRLQPPACDLHPDGPPAQ
jgi:hypothetical protein